MGLRWVGELGVLGGFEDEDEDGDGDGKVVEVWVFMGEERRGWCLWSELRTRYDTFLWVVVLVVWLFNIPLD